jgi:hypothetical protein
MDIKISKASAGSIFRFVEIIQPDLLFLCTISARTTFQHDPRSHAEIRIGLHVPFKILAQKFVSQWLNQSPLCNQIMLPFILLKSDVNKHFAFRENLTLQIPLVGSFIKIC